MNLSKIYRGTETDGMQQFQFRSFGDPEPASAQAASFDPSAAPIVPPAPVASGPTAQDLEEAYAKGRREGLNEADKGLTTATQGLVAALEEVSRLREGLANNGTQDMLRMVMAVSEQIIRREVAADPAVVQGIIENALQSSVRADQYRVRVNSADLDKVTEKKPLFLASISGLKNLSIEGDPSISPGGCRVESELGEVDATLETQLESIQQALIEAISDV
jgi:flagellar assembly protein FliH